MRRAIRVAVVTVLAISMFVAATTSAAASSGYNAVAGEHGGGGAGSLPFTGVDLAVYVIVASLVIACGVALRALSHRIS